MFRVGIYDLFGTKRYSLCDFDEENNYKILNSYTVPLNTILINEKINSNSKPYLLDNKYVDIDYNSFNLLLENNKLNNNIVSLDKMLLSLILKNLDLQLGDNLKDYFEYQKGLLRKIFIDKGIINHKSRKLEDEVVIPVFDNLNEEKQELLLSKFGNRTNTSLLWRSIAACLGAESLFEKYNIRDKDSILIVDSVNKAIIVTKLDMSENDDRLIPCHKSYLDSYDKFNKDYYQKYENTNYIKFSSKEKYEDNYKKTNIKKIPYKNSKGLWELTEIKNLDTQKYSISIPVQNKVKLILVVCENVEIKYNKNIVKYCDLNTIKKGSLVYAKRIKNGEIAYYDQCDGLHIVSQNKKNEYDADLHYSTLIEGNDKAPGGKEIIGKINKDLFIKKGDNSFKFFIRMGNKDTNGELKVLEQIFGEDGLTEKCNLILKPRMKPGQGRAIIDIECDTYQEIKPFEKVKLDWSKLSDSNNTIDSMMASRPLSFPPPMGRVKANNGLTTKVRYDIIKYLNGWGPPELNRPKWPNRDSKTTDRFQRVNIFGNEPNYRLPSSLGENGKIVKDFLIKLNTDYLETKNSSFLKAIAWTYQGKSQGYFNQIIDYMLSIINKNIMGAIEASFYTNMIEDNSDLIKVYKACYNKISHNYDGITNYLRCLYQILMNYEFIYLKSISNKDCILLMKHLSNIYINKIDNPMTSKYALLSILFLLKRRQVYPGFCRKDNGDDLYEHVIESLNTRSTSENEKLSEIIKEFIDGKGSIEGIPLE